MARRPDSATAALALAALVLAGCELFRSGAPAADVHSADAAVVPEDAGPCGAEGQLCCRSGASNCSEPRLLCAYYNIRDDRYTRFNGTCIPGEGAPCFQDTHCTRWNPRAVCRYVPDPSFGHCTLPPSACGGRGEPCCPAATTDTCRSPDDRCRDARCCAPSEGASCTSDGDCCTRYCARAPDGTGACALCEFAPAGHPCRGDVPVAPDAPCAHTTCPASYTCNYPQRGTTATNPMCCHSGTARVTDPGASASCYTRTAAGCNPEGGVQADPGPDQGVCTPSGPIVCAWPQGSARCPALWIVSVADGSRVYKNGCCYAANDGVPRCGVIANPGCGPPQPGDTPMM